MKTKRKRQHDRRTATDRLWDALSDILEDPQVSLPEGLRKAGLKAIAAAERLRAAILSGLRLANSTQPPK